ncbi:hypothetical protein OROHE_012986 [Orobanche hederae]
MELGTEKSEDEIVLEVLGHGAGNTKGLRYGPTPPSRRNLVYNSSSQYKDELKDKEEELQLSKAQVQELKTQVIEMNEALSAQNADLSAQNATPSAELFTQDETINKLMAFCNNKGIKF